MDYFNERGSMVIDYIDFCEIVSNFSDLVADRQFKKMPYGMWRALTASRPNGSTVTILWNPKKVMVHFEGEPENHIFCFTDDSFADFFLENYINNSNWNLKADVAASEPMIPTPLISDEGVAFAKPSNEIHFSIDTKVDKSEFDARIEELEKLITEKEKNTNMKGFNFDFGPVNSNVVRMSMYGLAVKNKTGTYVSYDTKNNEIMDVDIFNFEGAQFIWKMPVAIKDIAVGDVIVHQNVPMFVVAIPDGDKILTVVDPIAGERKDIMLARSPFGFNFATKVVNMLGNMLSGTANADNPFGNMWMLMAMSGDNSMDMNTLMPMIMMTQSNAMDPTMMMVMMAMNQNGKNDLSSMLPMMWALQNMNKPTHTCTCGGNCGQHQ